MAIRLPQGASIPLYKEKEIGEAAPPVSTGLPPLSLPSFLSLPSPLSLPSFLSIPSLLPSLSFPLLLLLLSLPYCSDSASSKAAPSGGDSDTAAPVEIHDRLSAYGLFSNLDDHNGDLKPIETGGSYTYQLNTPLFSDYAEKLRTLYLPSGSAATYQEREPFDFPVGTIVAKTFYFSAALPDLYEPGLSEAEGVGEELRLIETRLLVNQPEGWQGVTYQWDSAQKDAERRPGGRSLQVDFRREGETLTSHYTIPSETQCLDCHHVEDSSGERRMVPIGLKARHLNREGEDGQNQLEALQEAALLRSLPAHPVAELPRAVDASDESHDLNIRARDYLDINCAHCHNPSATPGIISQLFLNHDNEDLLNLGVCKRPGSAGPGGRDRTYDIVPGNGEESILWYRTDLTSAGLMPPLARSLKDVEGAALIKEWIDAGQDFGRDSGDSGDSGCSP